jgi:hypothetical protein
MEVDEAQGRILALDGIGASGRAAEENRLMRRAFHGRRALS